MSDRRHKAIAAPGDRGNVSDAGFPIRQRATERANMDFEIGFVDEDMGPGSRDQLRFAHRLARTFDEGDQEIESAIANTDGIVAFEQQSSCREQSKGTKADLVLGWVTRPINRFDLT